MLRLQEEDDNYEGDGGTSDGEGEGYDVVQGFRDDMKSSNVDRFIITPEDSSASSPLYKPYQILLKYFKQK